MSKSDDSAQSAPPTEREQDMIIHLKEIGGLQREIAFLESVRKVTTDEPSRESLERSAKILQGAQERLYNSLSAKYGITAPEADKIMDNQRLDYGADSDMLTKLRERIAVHGDEAVKAFENSAQFDAGVLTDLTNKAAAMPEMPTPQTEQEKIAFNLLELKNQEKALGQQIADSRKILPPEEIRRLEQDYEQKKREYKEKFAEVVKRPDKEQILKIWENAIKLELKLESEAKGREQTFSQTK